MVRYRSAEVSTYENALAAGMRAKVPFFGERRPPPSSTRLCATREGRYGTGNVRDKYLNFAGDRRSTLEKVAVAAAAITLLLRRKILKKRFGERP